MATPVVRQLINYRRARLRKMELHQKQEFDKQWSDLFVGGKQFIKHTLDNGCFINLYFDSLLAKLIYRGDFEQEELAYINKTLVAGDSFVDVGANIGLFSLYASQKVGATGKVITFEPSPKTFNRLKENIELNGCTNTHLHQLGISDKPGELSLNISGDGMDAWETFAPDLNNRFQDQVKVPVVTLDDMLANENKEKIRIVKIDVEGWEKFVLKGAEQFFTTYSPIIMLEFTEENTQMAGYAVTELYDIVSMWGYTWYAIENGNLKPSPRKENYPYENLIAIKNTTQRA